MLNFVKRNFLKIAIVLFIVVKSAVWFYIFPPFQTPDETSHFGYVEFLAEENRLISTKKDATFNLELIKSFRILKVREIAFHNDKKFIYSQSQYSMALNNIRVLNNKAARHDFGYKQQKDYLYPPLYFGLAAIFYKAFYSGDLITRYYAVRFFSVLISFALLYFTYKTAKELFQNELISLLTVLIVALQPMFSMMSIAVNPDNLIFLLASALFYFAIKTIKDKQLTTRNNLYMTLCVALALLTKQYFVVLLFMYLLTLAMLFFEKFSTKKIAKNFFVFILGNLSVAGWWWTRHLESANILGVSRLGLKEYFVTQGYKYLTFVVDSYWAIFGWLDTPINIENFHFVFLIALFIIIFGSIYAYIKENDSFIKNSLLFMFLSFCFTACFLFFIDFRYSYNMVHNFIQGRYFLVLIAPNMMLLLLSLMIILKRKYDELVAVSVFFLMLFLNLLSVYSYIIPRYFMT